MNRNVESHFATLPSVDIGRSRFDRSSSVKLSFNAGDVIPFYVDEVLPGDTFNVDTSKVVRMPSLITPIMDNIYLDTYFFFVPNRLVWSHWKEFNGENTKSAWLPQTEYEVPQITSPVDTGWSVGTIADYMGIPTDVPNLSVNALPFRAYALIMNEWFRDQNLEDPLNIPVDDATVAGVNTGTFVTDVAKGGLPYIASKYHDYFTSCLPSPQKGPDVTIPVGIGSDLPVVTKGQDIAYYEYGAPEYCIHGVSRISQGIEGSGSYVFGNLLPGINDPHIYFEPGELKIFERDNGDWSAGNGFLPTNLWALGSGDTVGATINQLRLAFQIQKLYERDARGGK